MKLLVNNNEATIEWLTRKPEFREFQVIRYLGDLMESLTEGDIVCGTLPLHIAAEVCNRGAKYWAIRFSRRLHNRDSVMPHDLEGVASVTEFAIRQGQKVA